MTKVNLTSKNIILMVVVGLLVATGVIAGQLLFSNANLKAELLEAQGSANERIQKLEEELDAMKEPPKESEAPKEEGIKMMSEEELLSSYFTETPVLIESSPTITTPSEGGQQTSTGPILSVTPEMFDLGTISKKAGIAKANYELKNTGNSDLTISYAFTSCGCTIAPLKEEVVLKPNQSYPLEVSYDPNFFGPDYELGNIEKTITILSNYSQSPFHKIKLKANILP